MNRNPDDRGRINATDREGEAPAEPRTLIVLVALWLGRSLALLLMLAIAVSPALAQDDPDRAANDERDPHLVHWQWMQELRLPDKRDGSYLVLPITAAVFSRSQDHLRDIRLTDAEGDRIPYALRIMRSESTQTKLSARQFDAGESPKSRSYQVSLELAEAPPPGHNEIEIHTSGRNFRRRVEVVGADTDAFKDPQMLLDKKTYVVHYDVEGKTVQLNRFRYDFKQFRHLRVRVFADATVDEEIPRITNIIVRRSIVIPGEFVTEPANLGMQEQVRGDGGPGSAWMIEFPDWMPGADKKPLADKTPLAEKRPWEKLTFEVDGPPSDRPFRLQIANPNEPRQDIFGAEWRWRKDSDRQLLEISFPEVIARRLRLIVTDFANEPLQIRTVQATRCVRNLIIETPDETKITLPLRLHTGNDKVPPANYVLAQKLPVLLKPAPAVIDAGAVTPNSSYASPPLTLHQRTPWLVYVVLGFASVVLAAILGGLAWQTLRRHDALTAGQGKPT
jgi:hypothetical protein